MKKSRKRILLTVLAFIVLTPVVFFTWFNLKAQSEGKTMNPSPSKILVDSVICIGDGMVNFYLIKENEKFIAFDAGNDIEKIQNELKDLNVNCQKVEAVFLTHSDQDHVAALKLFDKAKVYLSKEEETMVNGSKTRIFIFHNKLPVKEYSTLNNREVIKIGNAQIEGILVPGHTPGSMCYMVNNRWLFSGDAFSLRNDKIEASNDFFNMDTKQSLKSLKNINGLRNVQYFFTGHYGNGEYFRYFKTGD